MSGFAIRVVSLERAQARREAFAAQAELQGVPFTFFDAFDARDATREEVDTWQDEEACRRNEGRPLAPSEVACAKSHLSLYAECLERGDQGVLVLEDDAEIQPGFQQVLDYLGKHSGAWAGERRVVLLGTGAGFGHLTLVLGERSAVPMGGGRLLKRAIVSHRALLGTYAYYVTRAACESILHPDKRVRCVADAWDFRLKQGALSSAWVVDPAAVRHPEVPEGSEIEQHRHILYLLQESGDWRSVARLRLQRLWTRIRSRVGRWTIYPLLRRFR